MTAAEITDKELVDKLHFLIQCLEKEMPEYADYQALDDANESFTLFRALCNVRMPHGDTGHTLPDEFYTTEADVLHTLTKRKGTTNVAALQPCALDSRLSLWQGDITTIKADAIVNAANSDMLGCFSPLHGCIDNMIHTMAGVELREECYRIMRKQGKEEPAGEAKITLGYNLPAAHVIHTVGPIVAGKLTGHHRELLASCYSSVLDCAAKNSLASVVFCCISTGVFRFPKDEAARIAIATTRTWLDDHPDATITRVVFNVFTASDLAIYDALLNG